MILVSFNYSFGERLFSPLTFWNFCAFLESPAIGKLFSICPGHSLHVGFLHFTLSQFKLQRASSGTSIRLTSSSEQAILDFASIAKHIAAPATGKHICYL